MPGRQYNSTGYRYGFNGKENDNEVKGTGNQQDYGMRIYDPRIGKFLSVDPITDEYPELTPYQFASNRPIDGIDLDGLEFCSYDCDRNDPNVREMAKWDNVTNYRDSKNYQIFAEERDKMSGSGGVVEGMAFGVVGEGLVALGKYLYYSYKASKVVQKVAQAEKVIAKSEQGMAKVKKVEQVASQSKNPYLSQSKDKLLDIKGKFEKLIKEHKQKLEEFKKDPMGKTSAEKLKEMTKDNPTKEELTKRVMGRVKELEKQITKQSGELEKVNEAIKQTGQ